MNKLPKLSHNALIDGLSALSILRLPYAPAAETLTAVAGVWEQIFIAKGYAWDDEDAQRLHTAFITFSLQAERFPTPKQIIDFMPHKTPKKAKKAIEGTIEKMCPDAEKALDALCKEFGIGKKCTT